MAKLKNDFLGRIHSRIGDKRPKNNTPDKALVEAVAFHVQWRDGEELRERVQFGRHIEPWIEECSPTITPLYAHDAILSQPQYGGLVEAARTLVGAWEALPEGNYTVSVVARWLRDDMKPAIDIIRAALSNSPLVGEYAPTSDITGKDIVDLHHMAYGKGYEWYRNKWIGDHEEMCADLVRAFVPRAALTGSK